MKILYNHPVNPLARFMPESFPDGTAPFVGRKIEIAASDFNPQLL
jgi:hypothetical protein